MSAPPILATLGCRLNAWETEAMKTLAAQAGVEGAVVVNTCAVTQEAVRKAKQEIRRLAREMETACLPLEGGPAAVGMGNPHCVFFVPDAEGVALETLGPRIEHDALFPERTNVEFASIVAPNRLRMRVWERGAGVTLACGSGACATAVAAHRRGLTGRKVALDLDGGTLTVDWREDGVWMTGPVALVFEGVLSPDWLEAVR